MRNWIQESINNAPGWLHYLLGKSLGRWGFVIILLILLAIFFGAKAITYANSFLDEKANTNTNNLITIQNECSSFGYKILSTSIVGSNLLINIHNLSNFDISYSEFISSSKYKCFTRLKVDDNGIKDFPFGDTKVLPNKTGAISIPIVQIQGFNQNNTHSIKIGLRCDKYIKTDSIPIECTNDNSSNYDFSGSMTWFNTPLLDKNILIQVSRSANDISFLNGKGFQVEDLRNLGGDFILGSNIKITYTKDAWCDTSKCFKGYIWYNPSKVNPEVIGELNRYYSQLGYLGMETFTDKSLNGGLSSKINSLPSESNKYAKYATLKDKGFPKNNLWNNEYLKDESIDIVVVLPKMN